MAVSSNLTTFTDWEGAGPTITGYGGGQAGSLNTDVIIQGAQSAGRRVDNAVDKGLGAQVTAVDMSAAGIHVKVWLFVTQWAEVTQVQVRISSGVDDDHELPTSQYPPLGGFIPVWVDVSRAPEVGGSANEASINEIGVLIDIGDVGGNAQNLILDEILYGDSGLVWSGTGGDLDEFRTYETTNVEGVLITQNGIDFCFARLQIGDSAQTGFLDSGFTIAFPDQPLVASDFMGITIDLQNASSDIDLNSGTIQSADPAAATNRPDFIVTGTAGAYDSDSLNLLGMRLVEFTSACTIVGGIIDTLSLTQGSADISGATIRCRAASGVACITDPVFGANDLRDVTLEQVGSGHAYVITTPGTYSVSGVKDTGFGGTRGSNLVASSGPNDATFYNNSGGLVTLNIVGGGDQPSVRNAASSTTQVNANVSITLTGIPANVEVRLYSGTRANATAATELDGVENSSGGDVVLTYNATGAGYIVIFDEDFEPNPIVFTSLPTADVTIPVDLRGDRVYENP